MGTVNHSMIWTKFKNLRIGHLSSLRFPKAVIWIVFCRIIHECEVEGKPWIWNNDAWTTVPIFLLTAQTVPRERVREAERSDTSPAHWCVQHWLSSPGFPVDLEHGSSSFFNDLLQIQNCFWKWNVFTLFQLNMFTIYRVICKETWKYFGVTIRRLYDNNWYSERSE